MGAPHAALLEEMDRALLAEFGAREIYRRLARFVRDEELAGILKRFSQEEEHQVERLAELMRALGGRPRSGSRRRRALAAALAWTAPVAGPRLALRICAEAEETRARWYAHFQEYLIRSGAPELARACAELSLTKRRHAQVLSTWARAGMG